MNNNQNNPRNKYPIPPFPQKPQKFPGDEETMTPHPVSVAPDYTSSRKLQGKVALITGADSGIGRAVAVAYAKEGADILFAYYNEDVDAQTTVKMVEETGHKAIAIPGDIQEQSHCNTLVDRTMKEFGHLDILVSNAAYQMYYKSITDLTPEEWDKTFKTNIYPLYFLCYKAVPLMKPGCSVIATTSIEAYRPSSFLLAYAPTKAAIANFVKTFAHQSMKEFGIRINAVAPGPVWTPLIPYSMPPESLGTFGKSNPTERPAQPAEIAPLYVWLASDEASFVNGNIWGVTGGAIIPV